MTIPEPDALRTEPDPEQHARDMGDLSPLPDHGSTWLLKYLLAVSVPWISVVPCGGYLLVHMVRSLGSPKAKVLGLIDWPIPLLASGWGLQIALASIAGWWVHRWFFAHRYIWMGLAMLSPYILTASAALAIYWLFLR